MKKSLIALAALAAVGSASAQSSVTLYGNVDIGYGQQTTTTRDGTGQIRTRGIQDGANAGNRIGFRGTEDLGGGLKANFVVEQGISPTNPAVFGVRSGATAHQVDGFSAAGVQTQVDGAAGAYTTSTNRQSYVGLASATVGTFNIGRQYLVTYELGTLSGYNVGSEGVPGAVKAHLHGIYLGNGGSTTRANMVQYISPNFGGGFVARVQYGSGEGRESVEFTTPGSNGLTTDKQRRFGLMLQYANGPVSVAAAYTNLRSKAVNTAGTGVAAAATSVYGVAGAAGTAILTQQDRSANLFQLGGSYDFGVAKLHGTYNRGKNGGLATLGAGQVQGDRGFNFDYRAYQIGLSVPFGAIVPFVTYGRATTDSNNVNGVGAVGAAAATNRVEDYKQYQVGVRYSLSKRTTAYAFYGQTKNEAAAITGTTSFYIDKKAIVGVAHAF